MTAASKFRLVDVWVGVRDPRQAKKVEHDLIELLVVSVSAVLSGADTFVEIEAWAKEKLEWLRQYLKLEQGIPSHDTFGRVFAAIDPDEFEAAFVRWVGQVLPVLANGDVVAIDDKTSRRSGKVGATPLHLVSAFAAQGVWCSGSARPPRSRTRRPPSRNCWRPWHCKAASSPSMRWAHKLKARLSKGEKRNRKRMATVASVYEVAAHLRTAGQIMGQDESSAPKRPKVRNKRVWASLRQTPAEVIEEMFAEAERRDPKQERTWLVLVDGQEAQQREVEAAIARHRTDVVVIQDFVHVLEYLWKAAYCFHADGTPEAETWVLERAYALLQGKVSDVAAGMRRSATRQGLSEEARAPVDKCADYLLKNKERFDYATALANGWPIATRIIEGACRHLVKDRMDLTGARWSLGGAEAVLRLRSLRASGDFEEYMAFHHRQERQRNYMSAPQNDNVKMAA